MRRFFKKQTAADEVEPKPRVEPTLNVPEKPALKISLDALAQSRAKPKPKIATFAPKPPMPGVVPKGANMALDWSGSEIGRYTGPFGQEGMEWLGYPYLSELSQRPEYRRPVEVIGREMTRKWLRLVATGDEDKSDRIRVIDAAFKRFRIQENFKKSAETDGFFGRSHLYVDTGATDNPAELRTELRIDRSKVKKGSIREFRLVEPIWTYPAQYDATDPLKPSFYKPATWFVMGKEVHASRLLTFVGHEVPDLLKAAYQFGGISMTQMLKPYVDDWLRSKKSVSDLLHSFSTMVLATNMQAMLQGNGEQLLRRLEMFNQFRDNQGSMAIDFGSETLSNVSAPLGSIDKLQAQAQEHMSAVSGLPLIVAFGLTPSGLNASSDGEIRVFQDVIHAYQPHLFGANMDKVLGLVQLNEFGDIDPDITYEWIDLWTLDEAAKAVVQKTKADTDALYIQEGVVSPDEVRKRVANDRESIYPGLDADESAPGPPEWQSGETDLHGDPAMRALQPSERPSAAADKAMPEFHEEDHPRDKDGKFGASGSGGASAKTAGAKTKSERAPLTSTEIKDGKRVQPDGSPLPEHIEKLKIPPAWTRVKFSQDPKAPLLAQGYDVKGRLQSVYSKEFSATQAAAKFSRVEALAEQFAGIEKQNAEGMASRNPKIKDAADCLDLIMKMGIRPGSDDDTGADKKAYGATTLKGEHVISEGGKTYLRFTGKKGVSLNLEIENEHLAQSLKKRAEVSGPEGPLFPNVTDKSLLDYTHTMGDGSFKTKDFRTHLGTKTAIEEVAKTPAPKNDKEYQKAVKAVATKVSQKLGNTPTIALESYINPTVFSVWDTRPPETVKDAMKPFARDDPMTDRWLPFAHFGSATAKPAAPLPADQDVDPDDELIETPPDVVMMLGFDPAKTVGFDSPDPDDAPDAQ